MIYYVIKIHKELPFHEALLVMALTSQSTTGSVSGLFELDTNLQQSFNGNKTQFY